MNTHHNRHAQSAACGCGTRGLLGVLRLGQRVGSWNRDADVEGFGDRVFVSIRCVVVIKRTLRAPVSPLETNRALWE